MRDDTASFAGFISGIVLMMVITLLVCSVVEESTRQYWENEIVKRGFAEIVVTESGREFQWKGEDVQSR